MKIFLLVSLFILIILTLLKKVFSSAKRNLFKDQTAWSNKEIKIKYSKSDEISKSNRNDNFLQVIAEESKGFLEKQSNREGL